MKVLTWNGHDGCFCSDKNGQNHPIRDISEDDVLSIMRLILDDPKAIEMDPIPTDLENVNLAALVIYEELHKQFNGMVKQRDAVVARVDKQFEKARSYYAQTDVQDLFEEAVETEN